MTKGQRTQQAILEAMFKLMRRGIIAPTYTQIGNTMQPMATRATVCKHIQEMVANGTLTADVFENKIVERTIRITPEKRGPKLGHNLSLAKDPEKNGVWIMPWGVFLYLDELNDIVTWAHK